MATILHKLARQKRGTMVVSIWPQQLLRERTRLHHDRTVLRQWRCACATVRMSDGAGLRIEGRPSSER